MCYRHHLRLTLERRCEKQEVSKCIAERLHYMPTFCLTLRASITCKRNIRTPWQHAFRNHRGTERDIAIAATILLTRVLSAQAKLRIAVDREGTAASRSRRHLQGKGFHIEFHVDTAWLGRCPVGARSVPGQCPVQCPVGARSKKHTQIEKHRKYLKI